MAPVKECIGDIYKQYEKAPELAKFHRHLPIWFWMLSNKTYKIQQQIRECNAELRQNAVEITDYHLANLDQDYPEVDKKVKCLEVLMREYGADLLMASKIANLPHQHIDFARNFALRPWLLDTYPPTGEDASIYKEVPPSLDFCTLKDIDEQDPATGFLTAHLDPMYRYAVRCIAYVQRKLGHETEVTASERYVEVKIVENCMHFAAAVFVPLLLSCTLGTLSALKSEADRIIVLGVFCLVLCWTLILVTPNLKRSELFVIASSYFAVGGVYIGINKGESA